MTAPKCSAFVYSVPGCAVTDTASLAGTSLQWPCRRLQWLKLNLSDKIHAALNSGSGLGIGSDVAACAVVAREATGTLPVYLPP
jgi:hypothetical protein